jgi:hypothetical protein
MRWCPATVILVGLAGVAGAAHGAPCSEGPVRLQAEVLAELAKAFPDKHFKPGKEPDVVVHDRFEFGLQNLRAALCPAGKRLTASERAELIRSHFRNVLSVVARQDAPPLDWVQARSRVRLQLAPEEY